ncbi:MAG: TIGR04255 family protein, partial [Terracidiphilus sp.]
MMARPREHLRNAPIVEAVIDFRIVQQEQVSSETFSDLGSYIGEQYTKTGSIQSIEARFGVIHGKPLGASQIQTDLGTRYQTATEIAQFRVDGFTFSKIAPYTTWEEVSVEAFRLWKIYVEIAKPRWVSRVAVRYINQMRLPNVKNHGEYLTASPQLPLPIPQMARDFLTRVNVYD